jgi:predicted regulator of Ras-like GTPase activity (Roadblock/LC7/MglB family)
MNLKNALEEILLNMKTAKSIYIMDKDGLVVERAEAAGADDLEEAFIEFLQGFRSVKSSAAELRFGPVTQMSISTESGRFLYRPINQDYLLVLAMTPEGYIGEAGYRLKRAATAMAEDFAS